jgi:MoaA/NifB/PqqE/SkfB family radical SAM enzyme
MSCEPGKGEDMSLEVFRAALDSASEYVTLGGGEPTMHPLFEQMLLEAIAHPTVSEEVGVLIITNGKIKNRAMMLARLADKEVVHAELSTDEFHEPIDEEVWLAFEGKHRDVTRSQRARPIYVGRYLETEGIDPEDVPEDEDCACEGYIIEPNGDVLQCSCPTSRKLGNILTGVADHFGWTSGMCYRSNEYKEAIEDYMARQEKMTLDVRSGRGNPQPDGSFDDTIETVERSIRQPSGWQSVRYKGQRFQLYGGIRTNWFINVNLPIRKRSVA